jgi:hypothetical protein
MLFMWRTYFTGVHDDGEEVVGEKHLSVPLGYQKGASIRGLIGWVERGGMVAPGVLFSQRAPLRLWSDLADTRGMPILSARGVGMSDWPVTKCFLSSSISYLEPSQNALSPTELMRTTSTFSQSQSAWS